MTGFIGIVGVLLSLGSATPQIVQRDGGADTQRGSQQVASTAAALIVATPTYASDGSKLGGQATFSLTLGKAQVMFASAGSTLCAAGSATTAASDDAGYGWRVEVVPQELTAEGVLVMDVTWQRRWQDGRASEGSLSRRQLRLPEGGRIQLDYLGALAAPRCSAIGMALELARPSRPATGLYEVETWLMPAVYGESMQHQVLRLRLGDTGTFYFDDLAVPEGKGRAWIQGAVVLGGRSYNGFDSEIKISRHDSGPGASQVQGSATYPLKAAFGEVVEFGLVSFSLRVRVRQLR